MVGGPPGRATDEESRILALASRAADLMEVFERRCAQIEQRQIDITSNLQGLLSCLPDMARRSADEQLGRLPDAIIRQVQGGIDRPVSAYEQRLREAGALLQQRADAMSGRIESVERVHRWLIWKVLAITFGCLVLLGLGGGWLLWKYRSEIRDHQIQADLLHAYNEADVNLCDGRLCVRVETPAKKYGEYVRVRPR